MAKTAKSVEPLIRYRVHFHCDGINEVRELSATNEATARQVVEGTFPEGAGWYITKVERVDPHANLEQGTGDGDQTFPFPIGLL